ncbi:hypothetical protein HDG35_007380 [Paraburkholderia sp. JPY681]|nr:hypothetical protein [Paraburkholderia atlantica]
MNLREIQALHAQYSTQPVIIDLASHTAAMPALPAPDRVPPARTRAVELGAVLRKAGKPAVLALAIAALAAGGGVSAARIWHAMHETVVVPKVPVAPNPAKPSPVPAGNSDGTMPINVAPARPLVSSDLDTHRPVAQSALADVDARTLASQSVLPAAPASQAPHASAVSAAASPIRMQRSSPAATSVNGIATPSPATEPSQLAPKVTDAPDNNQPAATPPVVPATTQPKAVPGGSAQDAPRAESRPALRPLHRLTHHAAATANSDIAEPAAPAQPKAQPSKSGDVQLF